MNIFANVVLGWTPILAVATDGSRKVLEVTGWTGGSGTAPATGVYVGTSGYVANIASAVDISGASSVTWGGITGTLSSQTDLQNALDLKANLANPTFTGTVSGITNTMVGAPSGSGSSTGTNTGDNAVNSLYSGLVSNATHTGDATGATALTLATVNSDVGSFTNANITVNAKGLITAASNGSGGGVSDGDKGDITVSGTGTVWTIDNNVVTNAKSAQMTTKTYKGRTSGTTGDPEDVSVATLKTDLVLVKGDVGLGNVDNTSDVNKPVSTAQQTALDLRVPYTGATGDVDLGTNILSARSIHAKGTAGAGHLGLKHQSANITASGSESSIGANATGDPVWKNDGNAIQNIMLRNADITGDTKTKITYDAQGKVTAGVDATTADIADIANRRYVTDAQQTVIGNTSGTNTGDNATNSQYSGLAASKEDAANKQSDLTASATKFPTVDAVNTGLATKQKTITSGTAAPSGGVDGDIYLQYI